MAEHGTNARWQQHYRNHEEPCEPCKQARLEHARSQPKPTPAQMERKRQHERNYRTALMELRRRHLSEYLTILYELKEAHDADERE